MLFVESDKIYSLKKRHKSDTLALCARRAFKACKQGDGILCESLVAITTVKRVAVKKQVPVIMRKQECGGWVIFPLFYKSSNPRLKAKYDKKRKELKEQKQQKNNENNE